MSEYTLLYKKGKKENENKSMETTSVYLHYGSPDQVSQAQKTLQVVSPKFLTYPYSNLSCWMFPLRSNKTIKGMKRYDGALVQDLV